MSEYRDSEVRQLLVSRYRVIYRATESEVFILGVLHQRQSLSRVCARLGRVRAAAGLRPRSVLARRPEGHWIDAHAAWMAWSYVGLMAAAVAETLTRLVMPVLATTLEQRALWPAFWGLVVVGTLVTVSVGARMIRRRLPGAVERVRQ